MVTSKIHMSVHMLQIDPIIWIHTYGNILARSHTRVIGVVEDSVTKDTNPWPNVCCWLTHQPHFSMILHHLPTFTALSMNKYVINCWSYMKSSKNDWHTPSVLQWQMFRTFCTARRLVMDFLVIFWVKTAI